MDYEHNLPSELWTLIFSFAKVKSVARIVPQVSKQFNKLSSTEELWKSKCRMENMDWSVKPASESFKIFYFSCKPFFELANSKIKIYITFIVV